MFFNKKRKKVVIYHKSRRKNVEFYSKSRRKNVEFYSKSRRENVIFLESTIDFRARWVYFWSGNFFRGFSS